MRNKLVLLLLLFSTTFTIGQTKIDYVMFGVYCGECNSNCFTMYKITQDSLLVDWSQDNFSYLSKIRIEFNGKKLNNELQRKGLDIIKYLPDSLIHIKSTVIGEPDNRDQCGIYIQFAIGGVTKKFLIDTDTSAIPNNLVKYEELVESITHSLTIAQ